MLRRHTGTVWPLLALRLDCDISLDYRICWFSFINSGNCCLTSPYSKIQNTSPESYTCPRSAVRGIFFFFCGKKECLVLAKGIFYAFTLSASQGATQGPGDFFNVHQWEVLDPVWNAYSGKMCFVYLSDLSLSVIWALGVKLRPFNWLHVRAKRRAGELRRESVMGSLNQSSPTSFV